MTDTQREFEGWFNDNMRDPTIGIIEKDPYTVAEYAWQAALAHSQQDKKPLWVKPKAYPESSVLCYLKLSNGKVIEGSCRRDWDGIGWYKGYPGMCNGFSMADPDVVGWMYKHQTKLTLEQLNAITNRKDE